MATMFLEHVCDLLATLCHPPWTGPLNWSRCMTLYGEERVSFYLFVALSPAVSSPVRQGTSFSLFGSLPSELQLRVLAFCSPDCLFQLMHVSAALRVEASKLFWVNPDTYFVVGSHWLLQGAYAGSTFWDIAFLAHVQNIEIQYEAGMDEKICPQTDEGTEVRHDRLSYFWESFTKRFTNAKKVVFNQNRCTPPWRKDDEPVPHPIRALVESCTVDIQLYAFVLVEGTSLRKDKAESYDTKKWQRSLYQHILGNRWLGVGLERPYRAVFMPAKRFNGRVGEFKWLEYDAFMVRLREFGLWPLMVEALDRYHFGSGEQTGFSCPASECNRVFSRAGEWTVHAAEEHYPEWLTGDRFSILPESLRVQFREREMELERRNARIYQQARDLRDEWRLGTEERRREIKRLWLEQLSHDEAWETGTKAEESELWKDFGL
ncbi:hypothetical protein IQ06DRAFT_292641 [Phaeosphaeriaceae sp. SRC1lsM3a]|nr:hypothetical protein IQ06DRAFT_292641 [Stagonospora sp. SRC1lsM3a]